MLEEDKSITLSFNGSTLSGFAGCNEYSASYTAAIETGKDNAISVGAISTTSKTCDEAIMTKEQAYLADLERATRYRIEVADMLLTTPEKLYGFDGKR